MINPNLLNVWDTIPVKFELNPGTVNWFSRNLRSSDNPYEVNKMMEWEGRGLMKHEELGSYSAIY